jgi:hypothetical protein
VQGPELRAGSRGARNRAAGRAGEPGSSAHHHRNRPYSHIHTSLRGAYGKDAHRQGLLRQGCIDVGTSISSNAASSPASCARNDESPFSLLHSLGPAARTPRTPTRHSTMQCARDAARRDQERHSRTRPQSTSSCMRVSPSLPGPQKGPPKKATEKRKRTEKENDNEGIKQHDLPTAFHRSSLFLRPFETQGT